MATVRKFNEQEKYCPVCEIYKELSAFDVSNRNPPSYRKQYCRPCCTIKKYGLTKREYDVILERQHGLCAFPGCLNPATHVDHDHACCKKEGSCGKCVRGILCRMHNTGLGHFADDPAELRKAAQYVESFRDLTKIL